MELVPGVDVAANQVSVAEVGARPFGALADDAATGWLREREEHEQQEGG
jgi:hypothetical protein